MDKTNTALLTVMSITATLQAQVAHRIERVPGARDGSVAISPDGRTIGTTVWPQNLVRLIDDQGETLYSNDFPLSGISKLNVTDARRAFALRWSGDANYVGEWTSAGVLPMPGESWDLFDVGLGGDAVLFEGGRPGGPVIYRDGAVTQVPPLPGAVRTRAVAISADARTIAGYASLTSDPVTTTAVVWRDLVPSALPRGGWPRAYANFISADGRVAFGQVQQTPLESPSNVAYWINGSGPYLLGAVGYPMMIARGGRLQVFSTTTGIKLWTPWAGVRTLADFGFATPIKDLGIEGVSEDGSRVVGGLTTAGSGERYMYLLEMPADCELDYATDGFIDFFDYAAYVACFQGDCPNHRSADFNFDGFVDFFDYGDFVDAFQRGC